MQRATKKDAYLTAFALILCGLMLAIGDTPRREPIVLDTILITADAETDRITQVEPVVITLDDEVSSSGDARRVF